MLALLALGCATAGVDSAQRFDQTGLPRPPVLLVYDFAVDPEDVLIDQFGAAFSDEEPSRAVRTARGREIARSLSLQIVEKLNAAGIPARRASVTTEPAIDAIVVKGQFISVDEGNRMKRTVIGFGSGSSELRVQVQSDQVAAWGMRPLVEAEASTAGSKKPGLAVPVAGGAAAGTLATSAVVGASTTLVSEKRSGLDADAGRLAELFVERARAFYERQGWIAPRS
jgi:hypothetical protein